MGLIGGKTVTHSVVKHISASFIMGAFLYHFSGMTADWNIYARVPLIIIAGGLIYGLLSVLFKIPELDSLKELFFKK